MANDVAVFATLADRIEAELRTLNAWDVTPPAPELIANAGPFGQNTLAYMQWIQWILVPRLRQVAEGTFDVPQSSSAGTQAIREFDGWHEASGLIDLLIELDHLVAGWRR